MKKKVTSTDIAHAAGVSQSTVSMILNKKYKTGEASCCILPKPDESVLCYAASGD